MISVPRDGLICWKMSQAFMQWGEAGAGGEERLGAAGGGGSGEGGVMACRGRASSAGQFPEAQGAEPRFVTVVLKEQASLAGGEISGGLEFAGFQGVLPGG